METYREIDHSGDVGIEATGSDIASLLENITRGLFALQYHGRVGSRSERVIEVTSSSLEDLVVDWLSEVLTACGTYGELYASVSVREASGNRARGVIQGEPFDESSHQPRFDVKAVTYHALDVSRHGSEWRAKVIFDL